MPKVSFLCLLLLAATLPVLAMIPTLPLSKLVQNSEIIVLVKVGEKVSVAEGAGLPRLKNTLTVEKVIKGAVVAAEPLTVFTHDLKGKFYEDMPQLPETGTRALLFLKKGQNGDLVPVNRVQGIWPIQEGSDKTLGMGFNSSIQQVEKEVAGAK